MAILTNDEIMNALKALIGDSTADEHLKLLEDMTETLNAQTKSAAEDWEAKYKENDAAWRQRYKERFFNSASAESLDRAAGVNGAPPVLPNTPQNPAPGGQTGQDAEMERAEKITYSDLFSYD